MHCKECKYYEETGFNHPEAAICNNVDKLCENVGQKIDGDELIYPYNEGAYFHPQPYFGCIHFELVE